jgi:Zn-dependent protease with chaperone function
MIAAVALLGYAALLLTAGDAVLARARWTDRAPRLGVAAWLALTGSAVGSVALGGAALVVPTVRVSTGLSGLFTACVMALRAGYAHPGGAATAGAGALLGIAVIARVCWCAAVTLARSSVAQRQHRRVLAMTGRPDRRLGAVLVDYHEAAAWCLPGAGQQIVLTTAAVEALDQAQLAAVLAHERAHQRGRHHLLVALAGSLAAAFPRVHAFRQGHEEVARLVELLADDAAAAASPRLTVAGALLALAAPAPGPATLAAGGSATGARVRRLIAAPAPISRARSAAGMLTVAALAAFPLVLLAGPALAVIGRDYCPDDAVVQVTGPCAAAHGCGSSAGAQ